MFILLSRTNLCGIKKYLLYLIIPVRSYKEGTREGVQNERFYLLKWVVNQTPEQLSNYFVEEQMMKKHEFMSSVL